jgi:hypothetical protein
VGRVDDLGVELHRVEPALAVLEGGDRRRGRGRRHARAVGRRRHRVAVAHPRDLVGGQAREEPALLLHPHVGAAELGAVRPLDAPAELLGHELHAVADAQDRHAQVVEGRVHVRRALRVDRGGPAREHERERPARGHLLGRGAVVHDLRVDPALADPAGDELRVLSAEVDDEDGALLRRRLGHRQRHDLAH